MLASLVPRKAKTAQKIARTQNPEEKPENSEKEKSRRRQKEISRFLRERGSEKKARERESEGATQKSAARQNRAPILGKARERENLPEKRQSNSGAIGEAGRGEAGGAEKNRRNQKLRTQAAFGCAGIVCGIARSERRRRGFAKGMTLMVPSVVDQDCGGKVSLYNRCTTEKIMAPRQTAPCIVCRQMIDISDAGAAFTMMCRLVGIPDLPRLYQSLGIPDPPKSESGQVYMCVECCVEDAMGKIPPPTQPFSVLAHELISRMTGKNPSVIFSAWQELRERMEMPATNFTRVLNDAELLPPGKRLKEAS